MGFVDDFKKTYRLTRQLLEKFKNLEGTNRISKDNIGLFKEKLISIYVVFRHDSYGWGVHTTHSSAPTEYLKIGDIVVKYTPTEFRVLKEIAPTWEEK